MNARALVFLLLWPAMAGAQGYAGLGAEAEGYAVPEPGRAFAFPADHGPHPGFRIEWWYLTATLAGADGRDYGLQWTLFRSALAPDAGEEGQVWMGHAAVTTPDRHHFDERLSRGGIGTAGVTADPFAAFIDEWELSGDLGGAARLRASGPAFAYDMQLNATGPFVAQGDGGYSVKSAEGQASYYYSQPFYDMAGTLTLPEGAVEVTGTGWLDREWSSQPLAETQDGWDWFSLVFEDGARLMAFSLREAAGGRFTSATWIAPDGTPTPYGDGALSATPLETEEVAGRVLPLRWRLTLPQEGLDVTVGAMTASAWMDTSFPYWEGPVGVAGSHAGRGYLEMTGYE